MKKNFPTAVGLMALAIFFASHFTAFAAAEKISKDPYVFPPVENSRAFQQYKTRPLTDLSRLIYLIDRFGELDISIRYDNYDYNSQFAARIARWFLSRRYHGESVDKWIMQWCNTSIGTGNLIWVKLPDGNFRLAREILFDEIQVLDKTLKESPSTPFEKVVEANPTALSNQLLVLPTNAPPLSASPLSQVQFKAASAKTDKP